MNHFKPFFLLSMICFQLFLSGCASQSPMILTDLKQVPFADVIRRTTDSGFGGFYLDIEKTMQTYQVSRLEAHEIQNQMRDELESISGSLSVFHQAMYVDQALKNAVYNVTVLKNSESGFEPRPLYAGQFYIVLDLDETVLTQWYDNGLKETKERRAHLGVSMRDKVIRSVDKQTGENLERPKILNGPPVVTFRPKVESFLKNLEKVKGYQGFIIFTAKEDLAAWDIIRKWSHKQPRLFKKLKGVFTRNYLTYGGVYKKPSKDLRIIDEKLRDVFLVDDNESRVVQKELNYRIPKFNADYYWDQYSKQSSSDEKWVFDSVLDYILTKIKGCQGDRVTKCLSQQLGTTDANNEAYYAWLKERLPRIKIDAAKIETQQLFHQPFFCKDFVRSEHVFPKFQENTFNF